MNSNVVPEKSQVVGYVLGCFEKDHDVSRAFVSQNHIFPVPFDRTKLIHPPPIILARVPSALIRLHTTRQKRRASTLSHILKSHDFCTSALRLLVKSFGGAHDLRFVIT